MSGSRYRKIRKAGLLFLAISASIAACCPSGTYEDNFGAVYLLITSPLGAGDSLAVVGTVDTRELGCGVWTLAGTSEKPGGEGIVDWVVTNPNPNPTDACCYAYQFSGTVTGSGCLFISGEYASIGGKCTTSGLMYLQANP
ncbi:MAG: hypothetical protein AB1640_07480 [bacterium]